LRLITHMHPYGGAKTAREGADSALWIVVRASHRECLRSFNVIRCEPPVSSLVLVDESKAAAYLMVAVSIDASDRHEIRRQLDTLTLPGRRGLHMQSESPRRRRTIVSSLTRLAVRQDWVIRLYSAGRSGTEKERRRRCLEAIVADHTKPALTHVVFDKDALLEGWDRQVLIEQLRSSSEMGNLTYEHQSRNSEQLLAIPDAFAWCWARGGEWRRRVKPVIGGFRTVSP